MCNTVIANAVAKVVAALVNAMTMFTAYDVTCAIRQSVGPNVNISHAYVREEVRSLYSRGVMGSDYESSAVKIDTASLSRVTAVVYHDYNSDPDTYVPDPANVPAKFSNGVTVPVVTAAPTVSVRNVPVVSSTGKTLVRHLVNGQYVPDNKGRVRIPKKLVNAAGLYAGDTAYVRVSNGGVNVSSKKETGAKALTVDEYDNLLFTPKIKAKAYKFQQVGREVVVSPV